MSTFQHFVAQGYVGSDPETRYTPSGTAVSEFSIAITEKWKDKNSGEQRENTTWIRCESWGKQAEVVGEYVRKGSLVAVQGEIRNQEWQADDGSTRRSTKIRLNSARGGLVLVNTGRDGGGDRQPSGGQRQQAQTGTREAPVNPGPEDFDPDRDIPF